MSIYLDRTYAGGAFAKPSDDVDPNLKKEAKWNLDMVKYIYGLYCSGNTAFDTTWSQIVDRLRSYAWGKQDTEQYKKILMQGVSEDINAHKAPLRGSDLDPNPTTSTAQTGWMNVNFDEVLSPLPKYILKVIGLFSQQDVDVEINAIDENSIDKKIMEKYRMQVMAENIDWQNNLRAELGMPIDEPDNFIPRSKEEMKMFEALGGVKLPYEIGLERALDFTFYESQLRDGKEKVLHDLFCLGKSAYMNYVDSYTRQAKVKYIDVRNVIIEYSRESDYSNSRFCGVPLDYSIEDLRAETGMSEDEIVKVAGAFRGKFNNPTNTLDDPSVYGETGTCNYNSFHIPCLYMSYKSTDTEYYTRRSTKNGRDIEFYEPYRNQGRTPRVYNTNKKQTSSQSIKRLYHAKWIIGTDVIWEYGPVTDQPFNYNKKDVTLPITVVELPTKPYLWSMIPVEDQIALAFYRMQNNIAISPPPGLAIEWGALEDLTYENSKLSPLDAIRMRSQTGNIVYRLKPPGPNDNGNYNRNPIESIPGGVGEAIRENILTLENCYNQLAEMSGMDRISTSSKTPSGEMGVGTVEMAISATNDVLRPLFTSWIRLKERLSRIVCDHIVSIIYTDDKKESIYYKALGPQAVKALSALSETSAIELGIKIVVQPSDVERQTILKAAEIALTNGKNGSPTITYSEYVFIVNRMTSGLNMKYIQAFLAFREGQKEREDAARQEAIVKEQANMNMQLQDKKKNDTLELDKSKMQLETASIQLKYDLEWRNYQLMHPLKLEEIKAQSQNSNNKPQAEKKEVEPDMLPVDQKELERQFLNPANNMPQQNPMQPPMMEGMPMMNEQPMEEEPMMGNQPVNEEEMA